MAIDPERVRVGLERDLQRRLARELGPVPSRPAAPDEVRFEWAAESLPLPRAEAARVDRLAAVARARLGVTRRIEVWQSARPTDHLNAVTHPAKEGPIHIRLRGAVLARLDDAAVLAVLGHEIGHHLAHGPTEDGVDPFVLFSWLKPARRVGYREIVAAYCRAAELTADRFACLAARDLDAIADVEEAMGDEPLPASAARWTRVEACREYADALRLSRARARGDSHPEATVRVFAAHLFFESDAYRELTGEGSGRTPLCEVDDTLERLVGPSLGAEDMGLRDVGEPCLLDQARAALEAARARVPWLAPPAIPPSPPRRSREEQEAWAELERDPLADQFDELERAAAAKERADLEARFEELERRRRERA